MIKDAIDVDVLELYQSQILHENLFRHIVLPRYMLPQRTPDFLSDELELLTRMAESVEQFADCVPANTLKMIRSLAKVHSNLTANVIMEEINGLQPGETFAMFVRYQNCAIIIHMLPNVPADDNNIVVATFLGKVHPKEIYENPSDLEVMGIFMNKYSLQFFFCSTFRSENENSYSNISVQLPYSSNQSKVLENASL